MKRLFGNILGGVNYAIPADEMPVDRRNRCYFLSDSQNMVPTLNGYGTKRGGSSVLNATAYGSNITSFHEFVSGASYKFAAQSTKIGKHTGSSFTDHITGLTDAYGQWVNFGGYAIYVNGINNAQKTDGSTGDNLTADLGGLNGAQCVAEWGNRLWIGGYANNVATLVGCAIIDKIPIATDFSTATDPEEATDFSTIPVGNLSEPITGLFQYVEFLLIGKLNQIYALSGGPEENQTTHRLNPIETKDKDSIGFTAKNAITRHGKDILFLDGFDVKRLSGIAEYGDVESISILANIRDFFKSGAGLDKNHLQNAHFFHYKHKEQIWCSIPTGGATRFWFVIDYSNPELRSALELPKYSIFPMSGLTPLCFGGVVDGTKTNIYAGGTDGKVRLLDTGTNDTGTAIDAYGVWSFGMPEHEITCMSGNLSIWYDTACDLELSYAYGLRGWKSIRTSGNYTTLDTEDLTDSSWRGRADVVKKEFREWMFDSGDGFALKIRNRTLSQTFEMRQSVFSWMRRHKI